MDKRNLNFRESDVRSDVYGLLPVLTRQRLHGFAADFSTRICEGASFSSCGDVAVAGKGLDCGR